MQTTTTNDTSLPVVLVAEEDPDTLAFLEDNLAADGYQVLSAFDRTKALALLSITQPDVIVVDVNGETLEVIDVVRSGRGLASRVDPETPMLVLSSRADELHRIRVLERGGDDIVAKPFSYPELLARIGALLRRAQQRRRARILRAGPVTIDTAAQVVRVAGQPVALCRREYDLLAQLATEPHRVFTKTELLRSVWGFRSPGVTRTVDSHACRLRRKLAAGGAEGCVTSVWGVGYRLLGPDLSVRDEAA